MVCRLFVDEVGNNDLVGASADPNIRYLSLTGILTKKSIHDGSIAPEMNRLKVDIFSHTPAQPVILHRREMVRREGPFAVLRDPEVDQLFRFRTLGLLQSSPFLAITIAIDKAAHLKKYAAWHYDPYHYCLRCLVERYVLWMKRFGLRGDVLIEQRYKIADKKLKASFERIYEGGTEHVPGRVMQAHLTSKEVKFGRKSDDIAGLQICDLIAHPSFRAMRRQREGEPALADFGYEIVRVLEERRYSRHPISHEIDGWGRKWLP